jgi:hypothetical protein
MSSLSFIAPAGRRRNREVRRVDYLEETRMLRNLLGRKKMGGRVCFPLFEPAEFIEYIQHRAAYIYYDRELFMRYGGGEVLPLCS